MQNHDKPNFDTTASLSYKEARAKLQEEKDKFNKLRSARGRVELRVHGKKTFDEIKTQIDDYLNKMVLEAAG